MRKLAAICFVLSSFPLFSQQSSIDTLIRFYQHRVDKYLDKEKQLGGLYSIDKEGIKLYASKQKKEHDSAEFVVYWKDRAAFQSALRNNGAEQQFEYYKKNHSSSGMVILGGPQGDFMQMDGKPLLGKKIAIDPGHIGGTVKEAKRERKMVNIGRDTSAAAKDSLVIEGNITLLTAQLLKKMLEEKGATVMLTRNAEGENAFGYSFEEWMKKDFKKAVATAYRDKEINAKTKTRLLNPKTKKDYIFRYFFLQEDLKQRARKINAFRPDLTLIIHYNADELNLHGDKLTTKDVNMVFIPGSFMQDELETKRDRFEFLRLILSDDIPSSEKAAAILLSSFVKTLAVPAAQSRDGSYLEEKSIALAKGVYSRNLSLTRLVHGTVVYGESLFQDNEKEFWLLQQPAPAPRIKEVADAYLDAVLQILK